MGKEPQTKMDRYSVSLVYRKNEGNELITILRVLITEAASDTEALGKAIIHFTKETEGYSLILRVTHKIINN